MLDIVDGIALGIILLLEVLGGERALAPPPEPPVPISAPAPEPPADAP